MTALALLHESHDSPTTPLRVVIGGMDDTIARKKDKVLHVLTRKPDTEFGPLYGEDGLHRDQVPSGLAADLRGIEELYN